MATVRSVFCLVTCLSVIVMTSAVKKVSDNEELLQRLLNKKRNVKCTGTGGKCFNTAHCCSGLICATFDEDIGEKPEVPGNCVKSKDLQTCSDERDECPEGSECVALGRTGQRYCVSHDENDNTDTVSDNGSTKLGGLGAACKTSNDCSSAGENGSVKLCCQQVRRGRQGIKRLCDRITPISTCLYNP